MGPGVSVKPMTNQPFPSILIGSLLQSLKNSSMNTAMKSVREAEFVFWIKRSCTFTVPTFVSRSSAICAFVKPS